MTSDFCSVHNGVPAALSQIPVLDQKMWREVILDRCLKDRGRLIALFGVTVQERVKRVYGVIGMDAQKQILVCASDFEGDQLHYESLTPELTQAHLFERELFEDAGIIPVGHPWLKPVRKTAGYPFFSIQGGQTHEVAVGPVHAGIIEPGHFRFQCQGETVLHLEICLGYQHRGVEVLMMQTTGPKRAVLAESIAGDSVIGHGWAYAHALEGLMELKSLSPRVQALRAIALELERLANHVGDLGALAGDIGFLPSAAYFGRLRGEFLNLSMLLCGNRYGRSFIRPGGVLFDMKASLVVELRSRLVQALDEFHELVKLLFETSSVLSRFESTGRVSEKLARDLGLVGVAARASHVAGDVRQDYPCGMYRTHPIPPVMLSSGDVYARARVRSLESKRSLEYLLALLKELPSGDLMDPSQPVLPSAMVVSLVEGWRGEIAHIVLTDEQGGICRYKIVDPSFHNWMALSMAMRNNQISDFPLCNKSFNLSYAGHDL